jgi:hypothetical protein
MNRSLKITVGGDGFLDAALTAELRKLVGQAIDGLEVRTIGGLAKTLEIHEQRAGRLVRVLGLRDRFGASGRPCAK